MLDQRTEILQSVLDSRIKELPNLLRNIKKGMKTVWRFQNDHDFLYGWCIGRLEYILYNEFKVLGGKTASDEDWFIIKDLIELQQKQINKIIDEVLTN